jgi:inositol-polyphosphate multikinase
MKLYTHQVAGHTTKKNPQNKDLLVSEDSKFVFKTIKPSELHFYEKKLKKLSSLKPFIPNYQGVFIYEDIEYLKLENLTLNFQNPSILDCKIGRKTYEPTASKEKMERETTKYCHQMEIGFRFSGMKIFDNEEYKEYDRFFGRSVTPNNVLEAWKLFLSSANENIINQYLIQLRKIIQIFEQKKDFKFISTSLLFIHEKGKPQESEDQIDLRLIDFVHVIDSEEIDDDYLHGIKNIEKILKELVNSIPQ